MKIGSLEINLRHIGIFVIVCIVLVVMMNFNNRLEELFQLQKGAVTVRAEATAVMLTQQALQTQVAQATSPAAAEEYARSQAHMAQPGDQVLGIIPAPGTSPQPTPAPTPIAAQKSNWDIWMAFIFGQ
jgi:cell division protein FtsB